jgi:pre-60S factor REI1
LVHGTLFEKKQISFNELTAIPYRIIMFTCISCRVAFESADEQRGHFATDWHRYNMKRRVASLPPVAAASFNEKVMERREQNAVRIDPRDLFCGACR